MSSYSEGQTHQLANALESARFTADDITKLGQYRNLSDICGVLRGTHRIIPVESQGKTVELLLESVGTVNILATTSKFIARDHFIKDTGRKAKVKISYLGDNFTGWFLDDNGKVENPIAATTLCYGKLRKASLDAPIIIELGGEIKAETALTEMFSLMEEQRDGEAGVLLNNGYANIFYIRDKKRVLRAVRVRWRGWLDVGWYVHARSVGYPHGWSAGGQLFSRNPVA
jgi:hypothetical protein